MTVSGGLQQGESLEESYSDNDGVSIPMTVSGGLQHQKIVSLFQLMGRFNTDDGIGRATTSSIALSLIILIRRFNTDDGIGRATTWLSF